MVLVRLHDLDAIHFEASMLRREINYLLSRVKSRKSHQSLKRLCLPAKHILGTVADVMYGNKLKILDKG